MTELRRSRAVRRSMRFLASGLLALGVLMAMGAPAGAEVYAQKPKVSFSPTSGLTGGQKVTISVSHEPPGATLLALECTPKAISIGEDGCENRDNQLFFAGSNGKASVKMMVLSQITTASGDASCMPTGCLIAVVQLTDGNSSSTQAVAGLSFASAGTIPTDVGPPAPSAWPATAPTSPIEVLSPSSPAHLTLQAGVAGDLSPTGAITGTGVSVPVTSPPTTPVSGVGLLQLVLSAPGTSWASAAHTAVTVDVKVGKEAPQQVVLFAGSQPFTYAAVVGTIDTGAQKVAISVDPSLSTTGSLTPTVDVIQAALSVVTPSNPAYLAMAYAPIIYGRPDTAKFDTPLLTYVQQSAGSGSLAGDTQLTYTTIWTKEDAGTSFVPWLEWGEWGRMTDITETTQLDVTPSGTIVDPMYDTCGCKANYPVERTSPQEVEVPFSGVVDGTHMVIRNASGNDYQSQSGTTAYRMVQAPVEGPQPGADRDTVMDANPWTYLVSAQELSRWYLDGSTDPLSPEIGDSRQYAVVDVTSAASNVSAVGVEIQLNGSSTWYANDFGWGYQLYGGGHARTAIKLPLDWQTQGIAAVRLVAYPTSTSTEGSITEPSVTILGLTPTFSQLTSTTMTPTVVQGSVSSS